MKVACVEAIAGLARVTASAELGVAYQGERLAFGPEYLIPKPLIHAYYQQLQLRLQKPRWKVASLHAK